MRDAARKPWEAAVTVAQANRRRASESLADVPHRRRLPSYPPLGPTDRLRDLYGSLSALLGIEARIGRHLRADKAHRWHVDRLTAAGCIVDFRAVSGGHECDLLARVLKAPGASVPVPRFGSSDCRACPAHLVALPAGFDLDP